MRALAVNAGSSSLKVALVELSGEGDRERLAEGLVQRIGTREASARLAVAGEPADALPVAAGDHGAAVRVALDWLAGHGLAEGIAAVGHRVVHGGARFIAPTVVDDDVLVALAELRALAPLHNGPALDALGAAREILGEGVPNVAIFDTAFHASMPAHAARYAIDPELADRHGIRRYGFHGLAHRSMLERYATHAGRPAESLRLITLQLGNGCSAAAIRDGASVETTMGLTPLEGLVMGTRSGDVDPALPGLLMRRAGMTVEAAEKLLNRHSGLLGVSGRSSDMRDLLAAEAAGDERAGLAIALFCHRLRKTIGAYLAVLGGADAILFGGGIGLYAAPIRARACAGLEWAGIAVDAERNAALSGDGTISPASAPVEVFVAAVDEESDIARDALLAIASAAARP